MCFAASERGGNVFFRASALRVAVWGRKKKRAVARASEFSNAFDYAFAEAFSEEPPP